ncbi:MAG: 30S ribosomal protein S16 [Verrucomicrobiae bacterium]|nr:30S ribosomal protein S16 [Verrucomicrobiae bacterium]MCP5524669.1 30S ribosomal protein S16 [Verrucomicrobiales bacterium]
MVRIRLKRGGAKNNPCYRVVVTDGRNRRDGRFIEEIGYYNPLQKVDGLSVNLDRARYWLGVGAKPSETVGSFLKKLLKEAPAAA